MATDSSALRAPPQATEAEQGVLGSLLSGGAAAFDHAVEVLGEADFYRHEHRLVFAAVAALVRRTQAIDVVTVFEQLQAAGKAEEAGGLSYLNELVVSVASASNVRSYALIVRERSQRRRLVALADELAGAAFNLSGGDVVALADRYAQRLLELAQGSKAREPRRVSDMLVEWIDDFQARADGDSDAIGTGWADVDDVLGGGMRRGELFTLAARPSMGKSAWMGGLARQVAERGPVLVCSLEDSDRMFVARQLAAAGRVNLAHLRRPQRAPDAVFDAVTEGAERLMPLRLYIDDAPALNVQEVRHRALQVRRREGDLHLVVVDYLQLMDGEGEHRAQQLAAIARALKAMAKSLNCAVVVLSQLNRKADEVNKPPRLDHLAETDGLEQASDIVGLLWREHRRTPKESNKHDAQIEFAKNKNGACRTVHQWFDGATQRFENASAGGGDGEN